MTKFKKYGPELIAQGYRIRFIRDYLNLSQADFAKKLNVSVAAVSNWEKGYAPMGFTQLEHLLIELRISSDFVIAGHTSALTVRMNDAWREYQEEWSFPILSKENGDFSHLLFADSLLG